MSAMALPRVALACLMLPSLASANGRPPAPTGVYFKPGDVEAIYLATTFGLLVSPDGCRFYWLCEDDIGFGGSFDPAYAITPTGAILATTFHGVSVSRDGGCSFATATATLPPDDPGNISNLYVASVTVSTSGEICVGTSEAGAMNAIYCSTDDAQTFAAKGGLPADMWYRSLAFAPGDLQRIYAAAYEVSGATNPPTGHFFRSDDDGQHWVEQPLAGVVFASSPTIAVAAVDPVNADLVYLVSQHANAETGDKLYRSSDGGQTFSEVLSVSTSISNVVIRDAQHVIAATTTGAYESADAGLTFAPIAGAPQLACLAQRSDGVLFGCGSNYGSDHFALGRSTDDATTWQPVLRFEYITSPLSCAAGTVQKDTCADLYWRGLVTQLGISTSTCAAGPDPAAVDAGAPDAPVASGHGHTGCCEAGDGGDTLVLVAGAGAVLTRRRRKR